jgi:hypothetical protein
MKDISTMGMKVGASVDANKGMSEKLSLSNYYHVECFDCEGNFKWEEVIENLVTTQGLNYILDSGFDSGTQLTSWFVGLKNTGAPAAGDAASALPSVGNWTEYEDYDGAVRPTLILGAAAAGSIDNVGNVASFTIGSPAADVYGVFVVDDDTKGSPTGATVLYGVGDFGAQKVVDPNDTLNVTVTLTAASA